ncbi:hypothetical protein GCM10027033_21360 [Leucobacter ruminantium]
MAVMREIRGGKRSSTSWVASIAAGSLIAGSLVAVGVGAQMASADTFTPVVHVTQPDTLVLGEDVSLDISFENDLAQGTAGNRYNLSAAVLIPADVDLVEPAPWSPMVAYGPGDVLPGVSAAGETCASLGLEAAGAGQPADRCRVPEGKKYLVFENFSDLPGSATTEVAQLKLRPQVGDGTSGYDVGDRIPVTVNAYTSRDERFIPGFPGSSGKGDGATTSGRGTATRDIPVKALRIEKSEPSPENELLRGVHTQTTIYTLRVRHTGEGDLANAEVVDFLPAGLEYLGACSLTDGTTNAGGTSGAAEWTDPNDPSLPGALTTSGVGGACVDESRVETIVMTAEIADRYLDADGDRTLEVGKVYTQVTWNLGAWQQASGGVPQSFPTVAGTAGETVIRYRAGIPLFENEMFTGSAPTPESRAQGANLDNNTGPSTRHGSPDAADRDGKNHGTLRNVAVARGDWNGTTSEDSDSEIVHPVDVRLVKSVATERDGAGAPVWGSSTFQQDRIADYRLELATSEYAGAAVNARPNRLVDDLANGLCPVYPSDVRLTPDNPDVIPAGASGVPAFMLGDPNDPEDRQYVSQADFDAALAAAGLAECGFGNPDDEALFSGASLTGLGFDPSTGHFYQNLQLDPVTALAQPDAAHDIVYSARQNTRYLTTGDESGSTSSLDTVTNTAEIEATTTARPGVSGLENSHGHSAGDDYYAFDDSEADVRGGGSSIDKLVLKNDPVFGVPDAASIWELDYGSGAVTDPSAPGYPWTKNEKTPFATGDEVWFKIHWTTARGADVRNPVLEDFLPEGVEFDPDGLSTTNQWQESQNLRVYASDRGARFAGGEIGLGGCRVDTSDAASVRDAYEEFVGEVDYDAAAGKLSWELGSQGCYTDTPSASSDRFWPGGMDLDIYIRVTVTDAQAFGDTDISQNLAKYQQMNVEREIFFQRSQAEITPDTSVRLVKGVESVDAAPTGGNPFGSNVDDATVVHDTEVGFRIDVTAPSSRTRDYVVYDALPQGVKARDLKGYDPSDGTFAGSATLWDGEISQATPTGADAVVYDWDDPAFPAAIKQTISGTYANRSIVVWRLDGPVRGSTVPAASDDSTPAPPRVDRGFSLHYTVVVPDGTLTEDGGGPAAVLEQRYENVASVAEFAYENNGGGASTIVPTADPGEAVPNGGGNGSNVPVSNRQPGAGEFGAPADASTDPAGVHLPGAELSKRLWSTEIGPDDGQSPPSGENDLDPANPDGAIVEGEYATFEYSVTIPGGTTVNNGVLADDGRFTLGSTPVDYEYVAGSAEFFKNGVEFAACPEDFECLEEEGAKRGVLKLGSSYTNAGPDAETFSVRITVYVGSAAAALRQNDTLTNTARFTSVSATGAAQPKSATADVAYVEPALAIAKNATPDREVAADERIDYTLTVTNPGGRPKSYDNVVNDRVPGGLKIERGSFTVNGAPVGDDALVFADLDGNPDPDAVFNGEGGTITWDPSDPALAALAEVPDAVTLGYSATIDADTGAGSSYTNRAEVTGHTLPGTLPDAETRRGDRADDAEKTITTKRAELSKRVRVEGETAYGTSASAPIGQTVEYRVEIGLEPQVNYYNARITDTFSGAGIGSPTRVDIVGPVAAPAGSVDGAWNYDDGVWTFSGPGNSPHLAASPEARTLVLTYRVKLEPGMTGPALRNDAVFEWTKRPGGDIENPGDRDSVTEGTTVTVLDPSLAIAKDVKFSDEGSGSWRPTQVAAGNPDRRLDYRLVVRNTAATAAHNVTVTDCLPAGVVNVTGISPAGAYAPAAPGCAGGTITWTGLGPIEAGGSQTLGYSASFAQADAFTSDAQGRGLPVQVNTGSVTRYESFGTGGRVYTPGSGGQPAITDTANSQPLFPRVQLAKSVTNGDVAYAGTPFGWTLRATNTGRGAVQSIEVRDTLPANWAYTASVTPEIRLNGTGAWRALAAPTLDPGDPRKLSWSEADIRAALGLAGASPVLAGRTGTEPYLEIRFSATPGQAALTSAGVTLPNGTRVAHTNTLSATAKDTRGATGNGSGAYVTNTGSANAFLHSADLSVTKSDDIELIAGTTGTGWTIRVHNAGPDTAAGPITVSDETAPLPAGVTVNSVSGTGWNCSPVTQPPTPGDGASFTCVRTAPLAAGADTDPISVNVSVAASVPAGTRVDNTADVTGPTHDPSPSNNEDPGRFTVVTDADLEIAKTLGDNSRASLNAGDDISWSISVRNNGSSDSLSEAGKLITVTDTIPATVENVAVGAPLPAGWSLAQNGNEIVLTLAAGNRIAPGDAPLEFAVTGKVKAGTAAGTVIENTAIVTPGATPDSDPDNNTSTVPTQPTTKTTAVVAAKQRGTFESGVWTPVASDAPVTAGTQLSYLLTVTNTGLAEADGAQISDAFADYLDYRSWAPYPADESGWTTSAVAGDPSAVFVLGRPLPPGHSASVVVTVEVADDHEGSVFNAACVDAENNTGTLNLCAETSSSGDKIVDLALRKSHVLPAGATAAVAGQNLRYVLEVFNNGPSASVGPITVADTLPAGFGFADGVTATVNGATVTLAPPAQATDPTTGRTTLTWSVPGPIGVAPVAAGAPAVTLSFDASVGEAVTPGSYTNAAEVEGVRCSPEPVDPVCVPEPDPDLGNNRDTDPVPVVTHSEFSIEKQIWNAPAERWEDDRARATAGETTRYRIVVTNAGPSAAPVNFADVLPADVSFVSYRSDEWNCDTDSGQPDGAPTGACAYTANGGRHPVGSSEIEFEVRVAANAVPDAADEYSRVNLGTITWRDSDNPVERSDRDEAALGIDRHADLGVVKQVRQSAPDGAWIDADDAANAGAVVAGESTSYRVLVSNRGSSDAVAPLVVTDTLPAGASFAGLSPGSEWSAEVDTASRTVTFTRDPDLGGLPAGADDLVIEYAVGFESGLTAGDVLLNVAELGGDTVAINGDPNPDNDSNPANVRVERSADLAVAKQHDPSQVRIGDELPFGITVTNNGPSVASGITVTDEVPAGLEVLSRVGDESDGWVIDAVVPNADGTTTVTAVRVDGDETLAVGETTPMLTITVLVHVEAYASVTNVAVVEGAEPDRDPSDNRAEDPVTVPPMVTLVTDKTAVGPFQVGKPGTFRITVANEGPTADPGPITVTDELPPGLTFRESPNLPGGAALSVKGQQVVWTLENGLAVGEKTTLTLVVDVSQAAYPRLANTVVVDSPAEKTPESKLSDIATVRVAAADVLAITGGDLAAFALLGALLVLLGGAGALLARRRRAETQEA